MTGRITAATNIPQFPGLPANSVSLANSKGLAAGWTDVITPNMVSTLRYGFTRAGNQTTGVLGSNYEWFRGISTPFGTTTGADANYPCESDRARIFRGITARTTSASADPSAPFHNQSQSYANSFSSCQLESFLAHWFGKRPVPSHRFGCFERIQTELRIRHGSRAGIGGAGQCGL